MGWIRNFLNGSEPGSLGISPPETGAKYEITVQFLTFSRGKYGI